MKKYILLILWTCLVKIGLCQNHTIEKKLLVNGEDTLPYCLVHPMHENVKVKYPLLIFLHGSGTRGNDNEILFAKIPKVFLDSVNQLKYPCYILVPQCPKKDVWVNFPEFPKSIKATDTPTVAAKQVIGLIQSLVKNKNIDKHRIYLTGISMGGEGTFDMLGRNPDLFAAGIPVCAVADTSKAQIISNIPVWAFHGSDDNVNPVIYTQMMIKAMELYNGKPKYTEYPGVGHKCWDKAYGEPELLPWLFKQKRKK